MANEFKHKDPCTTLTQAEYIGACGDGHIFACQATGDILYASSATVLKNLGKGAAGTVLSMGCSCIPDWTTSAASATVASTVVVVDGTDTSSFVAIFDSATGSLAPKTDAGLAYNAGTGTLTATAFAGPITGNVTGNASGTALTVTQAAQCTITSLGTLTALQVDYINANASTVTITDSSDTGDLASLAVTTHGATTLTTTDDDAAAAHFTLDADGNITLDAATGIVTIEDGGTEVLRFTESCSGDVTVKLVTNAKDLIFTDNGDAEGFRILDAAVGVKVAGTLDLGHATANTLSASSGVLSIEGNRVFHAGGTDIPVADGGTGASTFTANGILVGNGTSAVAVTATMATKGHVMIGDGSGVPTMLAVGTNCHVMTACSSEATGVKWAAAAGGGTTTTQVFAFPGMGTLSGAAETNMGGNIIPAINLADSADTYWHLPFHVPPCMTSISAIHVDYKGEHTGNLFLHFYTAHINNGASVVVEEDKTDGFTQYVGTDNVGDYERITVPSDAYNGLSGIIGGETIFMRIRRYATHACDTYATTWRVASASITFA
jgi:hypothetical protein